MTGVCVFRLLTQLNEKEREYQELLRISVQRKQEQIDALRKVAIAEGNVYILTTLMHRWLNTFDITAR